MLYYTDILILSLDEKLRKNTREYMTKEQAYEKLKSLSGQDFGYDVQKWRLWLESKKGQKSYK
jgi:hypothetical protein